MYKTLLWCGALNEASRRKRYFLKCSQKYLLVWSGDILFGNAQQRFAQWLLKVQFVKSKYFMKGKKSCEYRRRSLKEKDVLDTRQTHKGSQVLSLDHCQWPNQDYPVHSEHSQHVLPGWSELHTAHTPTMAPLVQLCFYARSKKKKKMEKVCNRFGKQDYR